MTKLFHISTNMFHMFHILTNIFNFLTNESHILTNMFQGQRRQGGGWVEASDAANGAKMSRKF